MKVYHSLILSLLMPLLHGAAGENGITEAIDGGEGLLDDEHDDDLHHHERQLIGCFGKCKAEGAKKRKTCFDFCDKIHKDAKQWKRIACKNVCKDIFKTKKDVCKAHCSEGFLTKEEEKLCSACPCCDAGGSFLSTIQDPDFCAEAADGGHYFYEEDTFIYKCLPQKKGKHYFSVASLAKLSQRDTIFSQWRACQEDDDITVLQDLCFHPDECSDKSAKPPPEWEACKNLFVSVTERKFPKQGCKYVDFGSESDLDEYCKHVLQLEK